MTADRANWNIGLSDACSTDRPSVADDLTELARTGRKLTTVWPTQLTAANLNDGCLGVRSRKEG